MPRPATALLGLLVAVACHGGDDGADATATATDTATDSGGLLVPDVHLPDQNPASPSHGRDVSPRDHLGHASGWFFLHST